MNRAIGVLMIVLLGISTGSVYAEKGAAGLSSQQKEFQSLDEQVQGLKEDVLKINHELMLLEEKLVYPSSTQVSVFVSIEPNAKFSLDSIELKLDNHVVGKHVYTYRELQALQQGGVQRLHTGNIGTGEHHLAVSIAGQTSGSGGYKATSGFPLKKEVGPKLVELRVVDTDSAKPKVIVKNW